MGKIEADTTWSPLKCPRTQQASRTGTSQQQGSCFPSQGASPSLPGSISPTAATAPRVVSRQQPPPPLPATAPHPPPCAARPAPPAGTWSARAGAGTHAARPPRPPPAHSPNSCGRSLGPGGGAARRSLQGHRRQGGSRMGGCSHSLLGPLPTRPPTAKNGGSKGSTGTHEIIRGLSVAGIRNPWSI